MIVNSTDLKNNLGKYLRLSAREEIIVTSNGRRIAKLSAYENMEMVTAGNGHLKERAQIYEVTPRKASYEEFRELTKNSDERYEYIYASIYVEFYNRFPCNIQ